MFVNNNKYHQEIFFKFTSSLLKLSNIDMKLGVYAYYIISVTITRFHDDHIKPQAIFLKTTSSLLSTHGGETWYYVVSMTTTCFYDDYNIHNYCSNSFRDFSSNLLMAAHMEMKLGTHCLSHQFHDDNSHFSLYLIL